MAITMTTDMLYTRPGEADESDLLSAHNPLIWELTDGAIAATPTATVQIIVKDNLMAVIYTSAVFDAYLVSFAAPVATFRFDATGIIKHIIENYFYKEVVETIEAENYGSYIEVTIKTYDNAVLEDTEVLEYFAGHGVNQIGDEYGSNLAPVFYNDEETIYHFLGYPTKAFAYSMDDRAALNPLVLLRDVIISSLVTALANTDYDTFTIAGVSILDAENLGGTARGQSNQFATTLGEVILIYFTLTLDAGQPPFFQLMKTGGYVISNKQSTRAGFNAFLLVNSTLSAADTELWITNSAAGEWDATSIRAYRVKDASGYGSFLQYFHTINLYQFLFPDETVIMTLFDETEVVRSMNIIPVTSCGGYFVRWLNERGYYSYWLFSPYPTSLKDGEEITTVINSFSEMALANSRSYPVGYRNSYDRIDVMSATVPISERRKMMHLFISPAVYLWKGKPTENQNLITGFVNGTAPEDYDTFLVYENTLRDIFEAAGTSEMYSADVSYLIEQGEQIRIQFWLGVTSGEVPTLVLVDSDLNDASNAIAAADGYNDITLTATEEINFKLKIYNTLLTEWSTDRIQAVRKEIETDWVLCERVEGSHELREKKQFDRFGCTLVLPQNYTQQLSGQNL